MKTFSLHKLIGITILLLSQIHTNGQTRNIEFGKFIESQCPFDLPDGLVLGENFKFGYATVPEFHANPEGKTLELAVAIFPSTNTDHLPDPIVMNTSGPGKSNMDNFVPQIASMLGQYLLPERDIIIIELRGLRYSKPFLHCFELSEARKKMLEQNLSYEEAMSAQLKALTASKVRFEKEGINLSAFNNKETAADIALIIRNLGYEKFNIVGSSAGTLVAHHVMRDFPDRIRSGILDAGLPIDSTIIRDYVPSIVDMLKRYFEECNNDPHCSSIFPNLEGRFLQLIDSLNLAPVTIPFTDPATNKEINYILNGYRLSSFVFLNMFYSTQIPYLIGKILDGDYSVIKEFVQNSLVPNYFADGLGFTVFISESGQYTPDDIDIDPAYEVFSNGVNLGGLGGDFIYKVQAIWNISKLDAKKNQYQKESNIPVLVLNGEYDPVIPIKYDKVMKKHLKNSYVYRFDGVPHSAFDNATNCVLPIFLEFLKNPTKEPESSCIKNYKQIYRIMDQQ
jgi:pimeloyl-ACP methyl ester carboxylesterase